jgi:hypothetical protein
MAGEAANGVVPAVWSCGGAGGQVGVCEDGGDGERCACVCVWQTYKGSLLEQLPHRWSHRDAKSRIVLPLMLPSHAALSWCLS